MKLTVDERLCSREMESRNPISGIHMKRKTGRTQISEWFVWLHFSLKGRIFHSLYLITILKRNMKGKSISMEIESRWTHWLRKKRKQNKTPKRWFQDSVNKVGSEKPSMQMYKSVHKILQRWLLCYLTDFDHYTMSTAENSAFQRMCSYGQDPFPKCASEPL